MINYLLNLNIKIVPVFTLTFIYFLPNIIMKYKFYKKYTPIYTKLPIFNNSEKLQNFYFKSYVDPDLKYKKEEIKRINRVSSQSFLIGSVIFPTIFALILGFFKVPKTEFYQSIVIFLIIRAYQFIKCTYDLNKDECISGKKVLIFLYGFYLFNYAWSTSKAFSASILGISGVMNFIGGLIFQSLVSFCGNSIGINKFNPIDNYLKENINLLELDDQLACNNYLDEVVIYSEED